MKFFLMMPNYKNVTEPSKEDSLHIHASIGSPDLFMYQPNSPIKYFHELDTICSYAGDQNYLQESDQ